MTRTLLLMFLLSIPIAAGAHGTAPTAQHGGMVVETSDEHWLELVFKGNDIAIYVGDQTNKPVVATGITAKATILAGGKSQQVTLTPTAANSFTGKLEGQVSGRVIAVVSLLIGGNATQARFTIVQP